MHEEIAWGREPEPIAAPGTTDSALLCPYCCTRLVKGTYLEYGPPPHHRYSGAHVDVSCCHACGWWRVDRAHSELNLAIRFLPCHAVLKALDLTDVTVPVDEVRSFLTARYEQRFTLAPRLFEETVASVFHALGYETLVTAPSGDWGIDVYMQRSDDEVIGVQVKRWKNSVNVEQLTALTGALLLNECTRGVFVTTSRFRRGATEVARRSAAVGLPVELVDAKKFYEILRVAQITTPIDIEDSSMPWRRVHHTRLASPEK